MSGDERWARIPEFEHDGVTVTVGVFAHTDYAASTHVYTRNNTEVFHADKHCHCLHQGDGYVFDGERRRAIQAHTLEDVMTSYLLPIKPCSHCTMDIQTLADIVVEIDGVHESQLKYYEPDDKAVTTRYRLTEDGDTEVTQTAKEVY